MTIFPKMIVAFVTLFAVSTIAAASAQTRQPREAGANGSIHAKTSKGTVAVRAKAAPQRSPTEDEMRWMDRASASSSSGGGGGAGGGGGGGM